MRCVRKISGQRLSDKSRKGSGELGQLGFRLSLEIPPPVPPFLRNARRGKTPEGLSRRSVTEPASAAKPWRAQEESDFWCLSSEQAFRTSRFGEGGDAPANAGTQRRKGVYELRTVI